jgi:hypothetical protein
VFFFSRRREKETTITFDHILCEVLGSISSALCELFICVLLLFSRRKKIQALFAIKQQHNKKKEEGA